MNVKTTRLYVALALNILYSLEIIYLLRIKRREKIDWNTCNTLIGYRESYTVMRTLPYIFIFGEKMKINWLYQDEFHGRDLALTVEPQEDSFWPTYQILIFCV